MHRENKCNFLVGKTYRAHITWEDNIKMVMGILKYTAKHQRNWLTSCTRVRARYLKKTGE
jgi:hypothetical protein